MPTLQMLLRLCAKNVAGPADYLTGLAHPPVFQAQNLDPERMVKMAHAMDSNAVPPMVQMRVAEEDRPMLGRDYCDVAERERLFDTPCAIARVWRATQYRRRMVVSAEASRDLNGRPLTWHWVVLQGDPERIRIRPVNRAGSVAEITAAYHARRPIAPGSTIESCRVDIGCFAHNGVYYSAPGFISFNFLDNEKRVYDAQERIRVMDYADPQVSRNYVDPAIDLPKRWRDEYHEDARGQMIGWTRWRGERREEFTADGALVLATDKLGRPVRARAVDYVAVPRDKFTAVLEQEPGAEIREYEYASARERVGRIRARATAPAGAPQAQ